MYWLVLPALSALLLKAAIIPFLLKDAEKHRPFLLLLGLYALHNLCEVLLLWEFSSGVAGEFVIRAYYILSLWSWIALAYYISIISPQSMTRIVAALVVAAAVLSALVIFGKALVAGVTTISYALTAVRGQYYWVWQAFCLGAGLICMLMVIYAYHTARSQQTQIRLTYLGLAFMPLLLVCFIIVLLMNFGYPINAALVMPFATTAFLLIMLGGEYQHKLTDVRRYIPFSKERTTSKQILDVFSEYSKDAVDYRDAVNQIERLLVLQKFDKYQRNASETASRMGMPRSSLYSVFSRLNIDAKKSKHKPLG